jgi:hypothetical protein
MKKVIFLFLISLSYMVCSQNKSPTETIFEAEDHITAKYKYKEVETYIKSVDQDLKLNNVTSDSIDYKGFSKSWSYRLDSTFMIKNYYISTHYKSICCDSIILSMPTIGDAFISKSWLNSDKIMEIAERNGGKEFRESNKVHIISANLGEAVVPNSQPFWSIRYLSRTNESNKFIITINAVSGLIE